MRTLGTRLGGGVAALIALTLALAGATSALAQDAGLAPVVDAHIGTCAEFEPDPAVQLGALQQIPISGVTDDDSELADTVDDDADVIEILGDDEIFDDADDGYLTDDLDGDGTFEIGQDLDDDGVLTDDEVLGQDLDGDAALVADELMIVVPGANPAAGNVWKAEENNDQVDGEELVQRGDYVMVVHYSADQYGTYLACGEVLDIVEAEQVVIPMREFEGSGYFGVTLFAVDSGEFATYLFEGIAAKADAGQGQAGAETAAVLGDDGVFDENDEGYLTDDLDGDGIFEIGQDLNDDGILTDDEVLGEDANEDAGLTEDELI